MRHPLFKILALIIFIYSCKSDKTDRPIVEVLSSEKTINMDSISSNVYKMTHNSSLKLSAENQSIFLEAYYKKEKGLGYSLGHTIIYSCDFSTASYIIVEEGDSVLKTFNIDHDRKHRLPFTKKASQVAGGKLTLYASRWISAAFMKSNNNVLKGGNLLPELYQPRANYYANFIEPSEAESVPIWGLTIQNVTMAVSVGNLVFIQPRRSAIS
jgi:O-glycosyl hydrolase